MRVQILLIDKHTYNNNNKNKKKTIDFICGNGVVQSS